MRPIVFRYSLAVLAALLVVAVVCVDAKYSHHFERAAKDVEHLYSHGGGNQGKRNSNFDDPDGFREGIGSHYQRREESNLRSCEWIGGGVGRVDVTFENSDASGGSNTFYWLDRENWRDRLLPRHGDHVRIVARGNARRTRAPRRAEMESPGCSAEDLSIDELMADFAGDAALGRNEACHASNTAHESGAETFSNEPLDVLLPLGTTLRLRSLELVLDETDLRLGSPRQSASNSNVDGYFHHLPTITVQHLAIKYLKTKNHNGGHEHGPQYPSLTFFGMRLNVTETSHIYLESDEFTTPAPLGEYATAQALTQCSSGAHPRLSLDASSELIFQPDCKSHIVRSDPSASPLPNGNRWPDERAALELEEDYGIHIPRPSDMSKLRREAEWERSLRRVEKADGFRDPAAGHRQNHHHHHRHKVDWNTKPTLCIRSNHPSGGHRSHTDKHAGLIVNLGSINVRTHVVVAVEFLQPDYATLRWALSEARKDVESEDTPAAIAYFRRRNTWWDLPSLNDLKPSIRFSSGVRSIFTHATDLQGGQVVLDALTGQDHDELDEAEEFDGEVNHKSVTTMMLVGAGPFLLRNVISSAPPAASNNFFSNIFNSPSSNNAATALSEGQPLVKCMGEGTKCRLGYHATIEVHLVLKHGATLQVSQRHSKSSAFGDAHLNRLSVDVAFQSPIQIKPWYSSQVAQNSPLSHLHVRFLHVSLTDANRAESSGSASLKGSLGNEPWTPLVISHLHLIVSKRFVLHAGFDSSVVLLKRRAQLRLAEESLTDIGVPDEISHQKHSTPSSDSSAVLFQGSKPQRERPRRVSWYGLDAEGDASGTASAAVVNDGVLQMHVPTFFQPELAGKGVVKRLYRGSNHHRRHPRHHHRGQEDVDSFEEEYLSRWRDGERRGGRDRAAAPQHTDAELRDFLDAADGMSAAQIARENDIRRRHKHRHPHRSHRRGHHGKNHEEDASSEIEEELELERYDRRRAPPRDRPHRGRDSFIEEYELNNFEPRRSSFVSDERQMDLSLLYSGAYLLIVFSSFVLLVFAVFREQKELLSALLASWSHVAMLLIISQLPVPFPPSVRILQSALDPRRCLLLLHDRLGLQSYLTPEQLVVWAIFTTVSFIAFLVLMHYVSAWLAHWNEVDSVHGVDSKKADLIVFNKQWHQYFMLADLEEMKRVNAGDDKNDQATHEDLNGLAETLLTSVAVALCPVVGVASLAAEVTVAAGFTFHDKWRAERDNLRVEHAQMLEKLRSIKSEEAGVKQAIQDVAKSICRGIAKDVIVLEYSTSQKDSEAPQFKHVVEMRSGEDSPGYSPRSSFLRLVSADDERIFVLYDQTNHTFTPLQPFDPELHAKKNSTKLTPKTLHDLSGHLLVLAFTLWSAVAPFLWSLLLSSDERHVSAIRYLFRLSGVTSAVLLLLSCSAIEHTFLYFLLRRKRGDEALAAVDEKTLPGFASFFGHASHEAARSMIQFLTGRSQFGLRTSYILLDVIPQLMDLGAMFRIFIALFFAGLVVALVLKQRKKYIKKVDLILRHIPLAISINYLFALLFYVLMPVVKRGTGTLAGDWLAFRLLELSWWAFNVIVVVLLLVTPLIPDDKSEKHEKKEKDEHEKKDKRDKKDKHDKKSMKKEELGQNPHASSASHPASSSVSLDQLSASTFSRAAKVSAANRGSVVPGNVASMAPTQHELDEREEAKSVPPVQSSAPSPVPAAKASSSSSDSASPTTPAKAMGPAGSSSTQKPKADAASTATASSAAIPQLHEAALPVPASSDADESHTEIQQAPAKRPAGKNSKN